MDAAILHDRLAATEKALLQVDERLDALGNSDQTEALLARLTSLEVTLAECQTQLQSLVAQQAEARIAEAQADEAEALADQAEAEAEVAEAIAETAQEPLPEEPETSEEIVELEPEPESEGEGPASKPRSNWLENFLTLR